MRVVTAKKKMFEADCRQACMVQLGIRLFVPRFIVVYETRLNYLAQGYAETLSWRGHLFYHDDKCVHAS